MGCCTCSGRQRVIRVLSRLPVGRPILTLLAARRLRRQGGEERQHQIIEGLAAFAQPSGVTTRQVYEQLLNELLDDLRLKAPFDIVLLGMHGAMVADGHDDCEGDTLARVREIVGPSTVVGVELDLHCSVTEAIVGNADAVVIYKEYPHVDIGPRAEELFDICTRAHAGEVRPVMVLHDCRMIERDGERFTPHHCLAEALG